MRKLKQPTRVELATHMDALVAALVEIRDQDWTGSPKDVALDALAAHARWMKKAF